MIGAWVDQVLDRVREAGGDPNSIRLVRAVHTPLAPDGLGVTLSFESLLTEGHPIHSAPQDREIEAIGPAGVWRRCCFARSRHARVAPRRELCIIEADGTHTPFPQARRWRPVETNNERTGSETSAND